MKISIFGHFYRKCIILIYWSNLLLYCHKHIFQAVWHSVNIYCLNKNIDIRMSRLWLSHIIEVPFCLEKWHFCPRLQSCTDEAISLILATHRLWCLSHHLDTPLHSLCVAWVSVECDDGRSWFPYELSELIVADTHCGGWLSHAHRHPIDHCGIYT